MYIDIIKRNKTKLRGKNYVLIAKDYMNSKAPFPPLFLHQKTSQGKNGVLREREKAGIKITF